MIWVRLFPREAVEDVARRVSGILHRDLLPGGPPYWHADSQKWQLDRSNCWFASEDPDSLGWVSIRARYRSMHDLEAVALVLRQLDKREVRFVPPRDEPTSSRAA